MEFVQGFVVGVVSVVGFLICRKVLGHYRPDSMGRWHSTERRQMLAKDGHL